MLKHKYLILTVLTATLLGCAPPPQRVYVYETSLPASPYATTYTCTQYPYGNAYRFQTNQPYGTNTYWYGRPCY